MKTFTAEQVSLLLDEQFNKLIHKLPIASVMSATGALEEFIKAIKEEINDYHNEPDYDCGDQLLEDNRMSETIMAMNHPNFFEQ